jgi:hypothetical protein
MVSSPLGNCADASQDDLKGDSEMNHHLANLTLTMHYKGEGRTTKLALTPLAIGQLALEAGLRDMSIGEFVSELVTATIQKNLFQRVLDIS